MTTPKINRFVWQLAEADGSNKGNFPKDAEKVFVNTPTPQWKIFPKPLRHKNLCIPTMQQRDWRGGSCHRWHPDRLPAPEPWPTPCTLHSLHLRYSRQSLSLLHLGCAPCEHRAERHHRSQRSTSSRGESNLLPRNWLRVLAPDLKESERNIDDGAGGFSAASLCRWANTFYRLQWVWGQPN